MIKNIIFVFVTVVLGFLLYSQGKTLIYADLSVQPALKTQNTPGGDPGVYFISYADGPEIFYKNQNGLADSVINKGVDFILNYRRQHLSKTFLNENKFLLAQKPGAGYWIWKPWVILHTLETIPENAIVIYADSGFVFRQSLVPLIELAKQHEIILLEHLPKRLYGPLGKSVQRETLVRMDCDTPTCRQATSYWAAFNLFRNTPKARAFVKEWLLHCQDPKKVMSVHRSDLPEYPEFSKHFNDEAILNVLAFQHQEDIFALSEEVFLGEYASWHHRHPNQNKDYLSLLPEVQQRGKMRGVERDFMNSRLMRWIRKKVFET